MIQAMHGKLQLPFKASNGFQIFMRRFVSCIGLTLLALLVSGWGSMLAATLCPHAGTSQTQAVAEDHSACHAKIEKTKEHHSNSSGSEALHTAKTKLTPVLRLHGGNNTASFVQPAESCTHCVSQNELPATPAASVQELALQKRDAGKAVEQTTTLVSPSMAFTAQFAPTQHAPPGLTNRKHILLGVFLI